MARPRLFLIDAAVKLSLVGLLAFGAFAGLERFAGKAFGWRLIGYSAAALLVPAIWALRGRRSPYPYAIDALFVLPFLIDTVGNALNLYDTVDWWDDANHFVNWAILTGAVAVGLAHVIDRRWEVFWLIVGFGAATAILWEVGEYFAFIRHSMELKTAYTRPGAGTRRLDAPRGDRGRAQISASGKLRCARGGTRKFCRCVVDST